MCDIYYNGDNFDIQRSMLFVIYDTLAQWPFPYNPYTYLFIRIAIDIISVGKIVVKAHLLHVLSYLVVYTSCSVD